MLSGNNIEAIIPESACDDWLIVYYYSSSINHKNFIFVKKVNVLSYVFYTNFEYKNFYNNM